MRIFYLTILSAILFSSCIHETKKKVLKETTKEDLKTGKKNEIQNNIIKQDICLLDKIEMYTSEHNGIKFYTENTLRGKGVITVSIFQRLEFLNLNRTSFGSISKSKIGDNYEIKLPKTVIAREIIPNEDFQVFSFDAEIPEANKDFIIVYINQEKRLLKKESIKYKFETWNEYVKSSFIQLTSNTDNVSKEEKMYWYKVLEIKEDSMKIKSVKKESCDYIENYKDVTKWVKWRDSSSKLIKFNFCY